MTDNIQIEINQWVKCSCGCEGVGKVLEIHSPGDAGWRAGAAPVDLVIRPIDRPEYRGRAWLPYVNLTRFNPSPREIECARAAMVAARIKGAITA